MPERILCLIRHPPVAVPPGVCYGASDVPLAADPLPVAAALRPRLPTDFRLVSSPASRCLDLAHTLAPAPLIDARLTEIDFGDWELRRFDDLPRAEIDCWAADAWGFHPPGGESADTMARRVLAAWLDFGAGSDDNWVIVSHGGPLRVIAGTLLDLPRADWLNIDCPQGGLLRLILPRDGTRARLDGTHK